MRSIQGQSPLSTDIRDYIDFIGIHRRFTEYCNNRFLNFFRNCVKILEWPNTRWVVLHLFCKEKWKGFTVLFIVIVPVHPINDFFNPALYVPVDSTWFVVLLLTSRFEKVAHFPPWMCTPTPQCFHSLKSRSIKTAAARFLTEAKLRSMQAYCFGGPEVPCRCSMYTTILCFSEMCSTPRKLC